MKWLVFTKVSHYLFYPDYLHRLGKYNRSNIGTVYYQSLHGLVPKASLPCPLFDHKQNGKQSISALTLSKQLH